MLKAPAAHVDHVCELIMPLRRAARREAFERQPLAASTATSKTSILRSSRSHPSWTISLAASPTPEVTAPNMHRRANIFAAPMVPIAFNVTLEPLSKPADIRLAAPLMMHPLVNPPTVRSSLNRMSTDTETAQPPAKLDQATPAR